MWHIYLRYRQIEYYHKLILSLTINSTARRYLAINEWLEYTSKSSEKAMVPDININVSCFIQQIAN